MSVTAAKGTHRQMGHAHHPSRCQQIRSSNKKEMGAEGDSEKGIYDSTIDEIS